MSADARWVAPPRWSDEQLDADRCKAIADFVHERIEEGPVAYSDEFRALRPVVESLFVASENLAALDAATVTDAATVDALRHLAVPPISADDLTTIVRELCARGDGLSEGDALVEVVLSALDPVRIAWLRESRDPTAAEATCAIDWTTGVWAAERVRTARRMVPSQRQEDAVAAALTASGYVEVDRPAPIELIDALDRGCFCREVVVAGTKSDMPVRLHDGRLLAIECKVSNSYTNSVKRLIRETGGKAARWKAAFGAQVVTAAVLSGVFKLKNLSEAQDQHDVTLFWEHSLAALQEYVEAAG